MKKFVSAALSAMMAATSLVAISAPADAQGRHSRADRERYVERYCDRNPRDRDCRDFRDNRRGWDDRRYSRWYRERHRDDGDVAAAAIFGLAAGAIAAGAAAASGDDHEDRCARRYRSYDSRTDTFRGADGRRYRCNL